MDVFELLHEEFKKTVLRKLNELQENAGWESNDIKKIIHEQNKKLNRELEMINMNQIFSLFFRYLKVIKSHKCDISNCGYSLAPSVVTHMPANGQ